MAKDQKNSTLPSSSFAPQEPEEKTTLLGSILTPQTLIKQIKDLYPIDREGNIVGPPNKQDMGELTNKLKKWVDDFAEISESYGDIPATGNRITSYLHARTLFEQAQKLLNQAQTFNNFPAQVEEAAKQMGIEKPTAGTYQQFRERYNSFVESAPASAIDKRVDLPESIPQPPARDAVVAIQHDLNQGKLPPKVEFAAIEPNTPTVKEVLQSNNPFIKALTKQPREKADAVDGPADTLKPENTTAREHVERGFKEFAEKAYEKAGGNLGNTENKERFVNAFMEQHKHSIDTLMNFPENVREARLADLAILKDRPETAITRSVELSVNSNPESAANSLSAGVVLNLDGVRGKAEMLARNNGQNHYTSQRAGGDAVASMITHGKDQEYKHRDAVIAKNVEKFPRLSGKDDSFKDDSFIGQLHKSAELVVLAEANETYGKMYNLKFDSIDELKKAAKSDPRIRGDFGDLGVAGRIGDWMEFYVAENKNEQSMLMHALRDAMDTDRNGHTDRGEMEAYVDRRYGGKNGKVDTAEELATLNKDLSQKDNPLAAAFKNSGLDIAQITASMQGRGVSGGKDIAVAQDLSGRLVADNDAKPVPGKASPTPQHGATL